MVKEGNRQVNDKEPQTALYDTCNPDIERTVFIRREDATNHISQFGALTVCEAKSSQITDDNGNKTQYGIVKGHGTMNVLQSGST